LGYASQRKTATKNDYFRTRPRLRQSSIEVFRDHPAFMHTVPEKTSLIDILIKVTEFTTP
jgi:hypothetical protein